MNESAVLLGSISQNANALYELFPCHKTLNRIDFKAIAHDLLLTMSFYEIVFIVRQDISAIGAHETSQFFKDLVVKGGGAVLKTEYCGLRNLAYPIHGSRKGHYIQMLFSCAHSLIAEVERQMRIHEYVVRFLTLRLETLPARGPSPLVQREQEAAPGRTYISRQSSHGQPAEETLSQPSV